jgi:hypothetical protein
MTNNDSYFKKALSDFAFDAAYGDSIRHLYKKGYSPEAIKEHLEAKSLSIEKIKDVIAKFEDSCSTFDPNTKNPDASKPSQNKINNVCHYEYVKEYDSYGHSSFIRRRIPD